MNDYELNNNIIKILSSIIENNNNFKLSEYGIINKQKFNNNEHLLFLKNFNNTRINTIYYYLTHTNFKIIKYNNANDINIKDNTLKYALETVGVIQTIHFNKTDFEYKIHINDDFLKKYGGFYDNNKYIGFSYIDLFWWSIYVIDMFTLLHNKYNNNICNSYIYLNIFDNPIYRQDLQHPHQFLRENTNMILIPITVYPDTNYPIYTFSSHKDYNDIELPMPDLWMFLFGREFSSEFNIFNYKKKLISFKNKIPKCVFRGGINSNITNENIQDSTRVNGYIKTLKHSDLINCLLTNSTPLITNNKYMLGYGKSDLILSSFNKDGPLNRFVFLPIASSIDLFLT